MIGIVKAITGAKDFFNDLGKSKEERAFEEKFKAEKERLIRKSDAEYLNELSSYIAKRINADFSKMHIILRNSEEIKELIANFKNKIKDITVMDDIRKEKVKLHQAAKAIVEKRLNQDN